MVFVVINMSGLFASIAILFTIFSLSSTTTLYTAEDPLWQLNETNFKNIVFGKNNTWIIEFYSSWCGHCQRFAPTYKDLAKDIKNWENVIKVGAVACNDPENVKLCRDYDVQSYPTIKLFWYNASESDTGEAVEGKRDVDSLEKAIITFLGSNWDKGVPSTWPDLTPLQLTSVSQIVKSMNTSSNGLNLFVEDPESVVGYQVILDLASFYPGLVIRRVLNANTELVNNLDAGLSDGSFPVLIKIPQNGVQGNSKSQTVSRFSSNDKSSDIRDKVFEAFAKNPRIPVVHDIVKETSLINLSADSVYMVDLENAIHYALHQEVGAMKEIEGENLSTLKSFLFVLKSYFPGSEPVMAYLNKLYNWISYKKRHLSGEEFVQGLYRLKTATEYLPDMREWIGCKGSQNNYRGYPCSLWTLFHTLTVQADMENATSVGYSENEGQTIFVIRDYVKHFFTCHECAMHFGEMAKNLEKEVNTSQNAVLWLWEKHNKVNHRLAGDVTEDPKRPKIQFPSSKLCSDCQLSKINEGNIEWNRRKILHFLHVFYGKQNIKTISSVKVKDTAVADHNSSMVISFQNNSILENRNFKWFTNTDISLCVSLYLISTILLVLIFLIFRQRQRRRRLQFKKYFRLQP